MSVQIPGGDYLFNQTTIKSNSWMPYPQGENTKSSAWHNDPSIMFKTSIRKSELNNRWQFWIWGKSCRIQEANHKECIEISVSRIIANVNRKHSWPPPVGFLNLKSNENVLKASHRLRCHRPSCSGSGTSDVPSQLSWALNSPEVRSRSRHYHGILIMVSKYQ